MRKWKHEIETVLHPLHCFSSTTSYRCHWLTLSVAIQKFANRFHDGDGVHGFHRARFMPSIKQFQNKYVYDTSITLQNDSVPWWSRAVCWTSSRFEPAEFADNLPTAHKLLLCIDMKGRIFSYFWFRSNVWRTCSTRISSQWLVSPSHKMRSATALNFCDATLCIVRIPTISISIIYTRTICFFLFWRQFRFDIFNLTTAECVAL